MQTGVEDGEGFAAGGAGERRVEAVFGEERSINHEL